MRLVAFRKRLYNINVKRRNLHWLAILTDTEIPDADLPQIRIRAVCRRWRSRHWRYL